jgi:hypothetical protein
VHPHAPDPATRGSRPRTRSARGLSALPAWALAGLMSLLLLLIPYAAEAQDGSVRRISRGWQGEPTLAVRVGMGAGVLSLHGAPGDVLYDVQLRSDDPAIPTLEHRYVNGELTVGTNWDAPDESGRRRILETRGLRSSDVRLDLALGRRTPMDLTVQIGASAATLDLDHLPLHSLDIQVGAGTVELRTQAPNPAPMGSFGIQIGAGTIEATGLGFLAPEQVEVAVGLGQATLNWEGLARPVTRLSVEVAMGQVVVEVPDGVGISVNRSGFLFRTRGEELRRVGDRWISENWNDARIRLEISASGALGGLEIKRITDR